MSKKKEPFFHYTDREGLRGILKDGQINESTDTKQDAMMGIGAYVTTKDPSEHSKSDIAENNYDDGWKQQESEGKVDYAIKVELDPDKVTANTGTRDVHVHEGPINLKEAEYEVYEVGKK